MAQTLNASRYLTVAQAARQLRCTEAAVRKAIALGRLDAVRHVGGHRIPVLALAARAGPATTLKFAQLRGHPGNAMAAAAQYDGLAILEDLMNIDHLSLTEAATYIQRSTRTVRRWVEEGRLPNAKRVVQRLLIPRADLDALIVPANSI